MQASFFHRHPLASLALVVCCLWLAGCNTRLQKVVRADPAGPYGYVEVDPREADLVSIFRDGQRLSSRVPLALSKGDEVRTGPDAGAVIRFANGGEAVLAPNTHVRLGSLEVFFGRILADVRGLFSAEDEVLAAGVEGTRFLFESRRGPTRVVVLEGRVRCTPKRDDWEPVSLGAGFELTAAAGSARPPRVERISRDALAEIERWAEGIRRAPEAGWCCDGGKVYESLSNQCRGHFETSAREARRLCEWGWCCRNGRVTRSIRGDCGGSFHSSEAAAEQACAPPPPPPAPTGWCCVDGRLVETDARRCVRLSGRFYSDYATAKRACGAQTPQYPIIR